MKNFIESGDQLTYVASATALSGAVVRVGGILGVNAYDVVSGDTGVIHFGVFVVPKVSAAVLAQGARVLWDASAGAFDVATATPATGDVSGDGASVWEAAGNGATTVAIKFTGVPGTVA